MEVRRSHTLAHQDKKEKRTSTLGSYGERVPYAVGAPSADDAPRAGGNSIRRVVAWAWATYEEKRDGRRTHLKDCCLLKRQLKGPVSWQRHVEVSSAATVKIRKYEVPMRHSLLDGVPSRRRQISGRYEAYRKRRWVRGPIVEVREPVLLETTGHETTETTLETCVREETKSKDTLDPTER